jgi:hypothetical protein
MSAAILQGCPATTLDTDLWIDCSFTLAAADDQAGKGEPGQNVKRKRNALDVRGESWV